MDDPIPTEMRREAAATQDEAIQLLSDNTRVEILHALWEAHDPTNPAPMRFSALRERVGVDDPGRLNYHLNKLMTHFIRRTDDGYELREAGKRIVQVLIAGTAIDPLTVEPVPIDVSCLFCGGLTEMYYEDGLRYHRCTDCKARCVGSYPPSLLSKEELPPAGILNRTSNEIYKEGEVWVKHRRESVMEGVCPECSGSMPVERIRICEDHDHKPIQTNKEEVCETCGSMFWGMVYHVCEVCKHTWKDPTIYYPVIYPAVIAFYYEHGIEMDSASHEKRAHLFDLEDCQEVVSADPLRIQISICLDGDELRITFDEQMSAVDVNR